MSELENICSNNNSKGVSPREKRRRKQNQPHSILSLGSQTQSCPLSPSMCEQTRSQCKRQCTWENRANAQPGIISLKQTVKDSKALLVSSLHSAHYSALCMETLSSTTRSSSKNKADSCNQQKRLLAAIGQQARKHRIAEIVRQPVLMKSSAQEVQRMWITTRAFGSCMRNKSKL